ncbi:hypothetical protein EQV77_17970 [Halobacillus fulvus]|nr:hypothetical protein EQV77_17970 [Halobacillus fulvus]
MTNDTTKLKYEPADMALMLDIKESTLRKYSLLLEKEGYTFHKGAVGRRWYSDNDKMVLHRFIDLKNGDMSLERSAHAVVRWANDRGITEVVTENEDNERDIERYIGELKEVVEKQTETIQELSKRLDQQQEFIEKQLRQRDEWIVERLDESMNKKEIQAPEEDLPTQEPEQNKKSWWSKLFK